MAQKMGKPIEIFAPGRHTAMSGDTLSFSAGDLTATAAAYDPAAHEAPLCVGHPKHDLPAYGWVERLKVEGGRLIALPKQVDPAFAEMVNAGRFKKVSAAFWRPEAAGNPRAGVWSLRHVGFLGAQPPAVKGLKSAQFAAGDEGVVMFGDVDPREAEMAAREARIAAREAELRRGDNEAFLNGLVREGRFAPGLKGDVLELMEHVDARQVVAFADGDGGTVERTPLEALKAVLSRFPKMVEFGEVAPGNGMFDEGGQVAGFAGPAGYAVDTVNMDLHRRAVEYQSRNGCDYAAAVRAVAGRR